MGNDRLAGVKRLPDSVADAWHRAKKHGAILAEAVLAFLVVASLVVVGIEFRRVGYFPHPFESHPAESLMDLYNTAYWANRAGAYAIWRTVYPPFAFVFLRLWTAPECYRMSAEAARSCDWPPLAMIGGFYLLNIGLVYFSLRKFVPRAALARTIALCAGLPMLYAAELANLVIPCFAFFVLGAGGLLRSRILRALSFALALNFKPYLLLAMLPVAVRRRWRTIATVGLAGFAIYLVTYAMEGAGSPFDLIGNMIFYSSDQTRRYADVNHLVAISARAFGIWGIVFPALILIGQLGTAACYIAGWFVPAGVRLRRFTALTLVLTSTEAALHTQGYSADYTQIFVLFLLFTEQWRGIGRVVAIVAGYLLCVSADYALIPVFHEIAPGYFFDRMVLTQYDLSLSQFARPALLITIQYALVALVMKDILRAFDLERRIGSRRGAVGPAPRSCALLAWRKSAGI